MYNRQQRRRAMLVLCIVALGVAMLCCACAHLTDHPCCGTRACAICTFLRLGLRPSALRVASLALVAVALACGLSSHCPSLHIPYLPLRPQGAPERLISHHN